jgi:NTE family protein
MKTALLLSAGAPHSPLMAGALWALYDGLERQRRIKKDSQIFDVIYTSGAGALIGLLLAAPKGGNPKQALRSVVELGVSDPIYSLLPINFKAFFKPGPFTQPIQRMARLLKLGEFPFRPIPHPSSPLGEWYNHWVRAGQTWTSVGDGEIKRLYNDLVDLWAAVITPTTLNYWSKGVCDPLPFIEDLVDFKELGQRGGDFFLNFTSAEDIAEAAQWATPGRSGTGAAVKVFNRGKITPDHVRAAFAYPFIYTPVKIEDRQYFEGANWEPISFGKFLETVSKDVQTVVLIDIVSKLEQFLLREPRNLWDAFGLSLILPVVAHAKKELARFEKDVHDGRYKAGGFDFAFRKIEFPITGPEASHILDWSYSNMSAMFDIGRTEGAKFYQNYGHEL